jgi:hypothetical protein
MTRQMSTQGVSGGGRHGGYALKHEPRDDARLRYIQTIGCNLVPNREPVA